MAKKMPVLQIEVSDRAGSLFKLLTAAAEAGVDLGCMTAASKGGGKGVAYLGPKDPRAAKKFVKAEGIKAKDMVGFVFSRRDACGAGAKALKPLADRKIKGKACLATLTGKGKCQIVIVVDKKDAARAARAFK